MTTDELLTLIYLRMIATGDANPLSNMSGVVDDLKTAKFLLQSMDPRKFSGMSDQEIANADKALTDSVTAALAREEAEKQARAK